jgi:RNA polymerase sigma-70 factor (ECF subfamily)
MVSTAGSFGRGAFVADQDVAQVRAELPAASLTLELKPLFERHYASVWRLLRRFGVPTAALDDAAQEVFWVAARRLSDIRAGSETAFLYGVALRVASNLLRRERHPAADDFELSSVAYSGPSPEEALAERQRRALLDFVLARMPLELRTVFVLFELEGLEVRAIAELEGLPVGTASSRLRRAREEFSAIARRVRASLDARGGLR